MGTFKTFTDAANRRKTMGTLNFYLESMQHNFKLALNHVRVIRSFFQNFRNNKHAILEALNFENSSLLGGLIKNPP